MGQETEESEEARRGHPRPHFAPLPLPRKEVRSAECEVRSERHGGALAGSQLRTPNSALRTPKDDLGALVVGEVRASTARAGRGRACGWPRRRR
jgi:hypothetical protein